MEYIYHHGIKGQKWGIRRYQNSDGSLTPAGKKRYSEDPDYTEAHSNKPISQMTTDELRRRNNRLQLERQYQSLTKQKSKVDKILDITKKSTATIATLMAAYTTYKKASGMISPILEKAGGLAINELLERGLL